MINRVKTFARSVYFNLTSYWKKPANGNFVSYKEVTAFSLGAMGQNMMILFIGYFGLSAGNTLLGSAIGIRPMHLQAMATVQMILNIFFSFIRGKLVDNTRTKYGRLRPYIAFAGIPILALGISFLFLPFEIMTYNQKMMCVFGFAVSISLIAPLFTDSFSEMNTVISPNTNERTNIISVSSLVFSFAPTIYGFAIPILTTLTGGYPNINTYRYIIAPIAIFGFILNFFACFGYKERVIASKTYVQKVGIAKGCLEIYRNKYWWIRQIAGTIGFLESAALVVFGWMYIYGTQNMTAYALMTTVLGTASGIAMASTPFLMRKLGNRKLLLVHNSLNVVFFTLMLATFKLPMFFFVMLYLNTVVNQLQIVYSPALHSEVKDYQQYISGRRMDFTFGAAGQIFFPITIISAYLIPYVYESFGLSTNYDILYDPMVRNNIFAILCFLSIIGAALNLIPFFFYKLSRQKHKMISNVLFFRAGLEDYVNGNLSPYTTKAMIDGVREADSIRNKPMPNLKEDKVLIKQARALPKTTEQEKAERTIAIKAARKNFREHELLIESKAGLSEIFDVEMTKYDKAVLKAKVAMSRILVEAKVEELIKFPLKNLILDKPKCSEKEIKKYDKMKNKFIFSVEKMKNKILKNYITGLKENKQEDLRIALAMPEETKQQQKAKTKAVRSEEKKLNNYYKTLSPYYEAKQLVAQNDSREHFETVMAKYDWACEEIAKIEKERNEQEAKKKADKKAEHDRIKQERFDRLPEKQQKRILEKQELTKAKKEEKAENKVIKEAIKEEKEAQNGKGKKIDTKNDTKDEKTGATKGKSNATDDREDNK